MFYPLVIAAALAASDWPVVEPVWPIVPPVVPAVVADEPEGVYVSFEVTDASGQSITILLEEEPKTEEAEGIVRLDGPRHTYHCLMCCGNWCIQFGYDEAYLERIGSKYWPTLYDNALNHPETRPKQTRGSGSIGYEYGPGWSGYRRRRLFGRVFGR